MNPPTILPSSEAIPLVIVGILLSVFLPVAVNMIKKAGLEELQRPPSLSERLKAALIRYGGNKYIRLLIGAIVVAIAIVFLLGLQFFTARDAVLAGFAWESFVTKLMAQRQT